MTTPPIQTKIKLKSRNILAFHIPWGLFRYKKRIYTQKVLCFFYVFRGKLFLELWVTTFLPDWQPTLIFVFLCMYFYRMASAHVILK